MSNPHDEHTESEKFHETHLLSLEQIFQSRAIVSIPLYQRNYTWQSVEGDDVPVAKLFDDFIKKYNDWIDYGQLSEAEYMLGTLVYVKQNNSNNFNQHLQIVDGQQRTSTITMLLCIVRDILIENSYDKITSDMQTWPDKLEYFINLVEIAEENPIVNNVKTQKHIDWKLRMNRKDAEIFKKYVQFYQKKDLSEFVDDGKDFVKISKKIEWLKGQLDSKTPQLELKDSQKLIISAYCYLYKQIQKYLIVEFKNSEEAKDKLNNLEEVALKNAIEKIKNKPDNFELEKDFFNNEITGYDVLSKEQWLATEHEEAFGEIYNKSKLSKTKTKPEFIKHLLSVKENKYKKIRETEKENQHDILNNVEKKNNIPILIQFVQTVVMKKMFVTRNLVKHEKDAIQIFDTMNSAGTELTKSNLIKNLVIKNIPQNEQSDIASKWDDDIIEQIGEKFSDSFIIESIRSRGLESKEKPGNYDFNKFHVPEHDKPTTPNKKNLYSVIQWKVEHDLDETLPKEESRSSNAKTLIDELVSDAKIYNFLTNPTVQTNIANPRNSISHILKDMNFLNYTYIRLPIYTAYREWQPNSNEFILLLKFLVPFFFKYKTMSNKNATKLEGYMITVCEMIKNGDESQKETTLYEIIKYLLSTYPDAEFENDLKDVVDKSDDTCKYVLHKINSFLTDSYSDVKPIDGLHLEHILPQSPKVTGTGKIWNKDDFFTGYETSTWPHYPKELKSNWHKMLGNLTLLHYKTNKTIGNSNFEAKLLWRNKEGEEVGFEKSDLPLNKKTVLVCSRCRVKREWWRVESILERTETLNDYALKVWKLPGIFCSDPNCFGYTNHVTLFGDKEQVLSTVCVQTCDKDGNEFTKKSQCGEALIVKWYDTIPEYNVPSAYVHKEE